MQGKRAIRAEDILRSLFNRLDKYAAQSSWLLFNSDRATYMTLYVSEGNYTLLTILADSSLSNREGVCSMDASVYLDAEAGIGGSSGRVLCAEALKFRPEVIDEKLVDGGGQFLVDTQLPFPYIHLGKGKFSAGLGKTIIAS